MMMRGLVLCAAMGGVSAGVMWLKKESPHPAAAEATRESPLVEARSLKPLLETTQSSPLAAYGMRKDAPDAPPVESATSAPPQPVAAKPINRMLPAWLLADTPEFANAASSGVSPAQMADQLRQSLRERGARQMGTTVRFAVLNVAEMLAMNNTTWAASMATPAANENRASALLLTFYLYHLDRAGDAAGVKALLRAMGEGMTEEQAVRDFILAGRSVAAFEREMGLAFANAGVELQFTRRGGATFKP
jgi:hypothetical protein